VYLCDEDFTMYDHSPEARAKHKSRTRVVKKRHEHRFLQIASEKLSVLSKVVRNSDCFTSLLISLVVCVSMTLYSCA
jgi:hypothetical protein